jgi:uncharacterized membrane protein
LRFLYALTASTWAVLVVSTPVLAARSTGGDLRMRIASLPYAAGSFICHQRPERSFHAAGLPLPVCARCTGIYLGAAVAAFVALSRLRAPVRGNAEQSRRWRRILLLSAVPIAVTIALEWLGPLPVSNMMRAISGAVAGAAVSGFVAAVLRGDLR